MLAPDSNDVFDKLRHAVAVSGSGLPIHKEEEPEPEPEPLPYEDYGPLVISRAQSQLDRAIAERMERLRADSAAHQAAQAKALVAAA